MPIVDLSRLKARMQSTVNKNWRIVGRPVPPSNNVYKQQISIDYALNIEGKVAFSVPEQFSIGTTNRLYRYMGTVKVLSKELSKTLQGNI